LPAFSSRPQHSFVSFRRRRLAATSRINHQHDEPYIRFLNTVAANKLKIRNDNALLCAGTGAIA
jgi:hypothetical protein